MLSSNTGSGDGGGTPVRSVKSSQTNNAPLEVMLQKTIFIEYSDAKRNSNWILDPVNLSPRTLFDDQLNQSMSDPNDLRGSSV